MIRQSSIFDFNHGFSWLRAFMLAAAMGTVAASALAQGHGGPPPGGMGPRDQKGQADGGFGRNLMNNTTRPATPSPSLESQGGLQLGPPGRWWDNKDFARTIGLNSLQQKHMDDVFGASRDTLLKLNKSLQHEEGQLEKLTRSRELDENQIFQQIDRVTSARGELEKAYAHMQMQIRKEMTPQQVGKMDELMPPPTPQP
jgi:Spy/CpxP family protein refolding chaperone